MDTWGKLESVIITVPGAKVEYPLGEWAEAQAAMQAQGYHLTYFEELDDALAFTRPHSVYYCEVEGIIENLPRAIGVNAVLAGRLDTGDSVSWPVGTGMARRIRVVGLAM